jgi:hypothetical protein
MLRPDYAVASGTAVSEGGLEFHVFRNSKPRTMALLEGAVLSAMIFTLICLTLGYNWRHPMLMPTQPPHWGKARNRARRPLYDPPVPEPLPTEAGSSRSAAEDSSQTSLPIPTATQRSPGGIAVAVVPIPLDTLRSYVGSYALELPVGGTILITLADGVLFLHLPGRAPIPLVPSSATKFSASGDSDLGIAFEKPGGNQLQIHLAGRWLTSSRRSSK